MRKSSSFAITLSLVAASLLLGGCNVFNSDSSTASTSPPTASASGGNVSTPPNQAPTADAGPDHSVVEGHTDTLTGSGSDSDGRVVSYAWKQTAGPTVTLTPDSNDPATVSYTAPDVADVTKLTFQLTVTDDAGATGTDSVNVSVDPTVTLSGTVTDGTISNATVTVDVNGVSYTTITDASGNYQITVPTANANAFMTATATTDTGVELVDLLGTFATLSAQGVANNSLNITNVTTAQAALITEANGGTTPTDQSTLDELNKDVDSTRMLDLAVAIKLVIDDGYSLPSGVNNTFDLVSDPTVVDQFLANVDATDPNARTNAMNAILSDPALISGFADSTVPATYMTTLDGKYLYVRGNLFTFASDHTGTLAIGGTPETFTWSVDSQGRLVINYDHGVQSSGFCYSTSGNQIRCDESDSQTIFTLVTGGVDSDTLLKETIGTLTYPNNDNTSSDPTTVDDTSAAIGVRSKGLIPFDPSAFAVNGTDWATPGIGLDNQYSNGIALDPIQEGVIYTNADGTGQTFETAQQFTWKTDADGNLALTLANGTHVTYYRLRKDGIAYDTLVKVVDTSGGVWVRSDLMVEGNASRFALTNSGVPGVYALYDGGQQFSIRLDSTQLGYEEYFDTQGNMTGQYGLQWSIPGDQLQIDAIYNNGANDYSVPCTSPSTCTIYKSRFWIPVAGDGSKYYVLEYQQGYTFDSTSTTNFHEGPINFVQYQVRYYTRSPAVARAAARMGGPRTDSAGLQRPVSGFRPFFNGPTLKPFRH